MQLHELTALQAARAIAKGECSSRELTSAYLARIEALEPQVQAFVTVTREAALAAADAADKAKAAGQSLSALMGVPIALKDNLCMRGAPTTCSSKMLKNFVPPFDATVVHKTAAAGMPPLGKTNLDEFAMGSSTENSAFFPTRNPWDLERVPGGSSGGSTACVAAFEAPFSLGSDTGGSIRQPAAFCGVVGLKPTYGRVSRYGLVAFASSLDQIGPLARDVSDTAALMDVISGPDEMDSTSHRQAPPKFLDGLDAGVKGLRIGVPKECFVEGLDPEIEKSVRDAIAHLVSLGAEAVDVSLPTLPYSVATYYICATAEASSNLARYDGAHYGHRSKDTTNIIEMFSRSRAEGFGPEVKRRIMLGTYALSAGFYDAYYVKGLKVRTLFKRDYENAFKKCDVILTPTTPTPPFKFGDKTNDPLQMYLNDVLTIPANLAGNPALVAPCGFTASGLPIGMQLTGALFDEKRLLQTAYAFEQSTEHHKRRSPLAASSGGAA